MKYMCICVFWVCHFIVSHAVSFLLYMWLLLCCWLLPLAAFATIGNSISTYLLTYLDFLCLMVLCSVSLCFIPCNDAIEQAGYPDCKLNFVYCTVCVHSKKKSRELWQIDRDSNRSGPRWSRRQSHERYWRNEVSENNTELLTV